MFSAIAVGVTSNCSASGAAMYFTTFNASPTSMGTFTDYGIPAGGPDVSGAGSLTITEVSSVPEPSSMALLAPGLFGLLSCWFEAVREHKAARLGRLFYSTPN